jgi:predicted nuclease of restriction endonuclease-like (RecB) superfamily
MAPRKATTAIARRTPEQSPRVSRSFLPAGYAELLVDIKNRIRRTQVRAATAANRELIRLYWDVGRQIAQRQEREGWGARVIDRLADDLEKAFPGIAGFSVRNIKRMRAFYLAYTPEVAIVPQPVAQLDATDLPQLVAEIPWGHNAVLLDKLKQPRQRLWYAEKVVQHGWSRAVLVHQIELDLYAREGQAITDNQKTGGRVEGSAAERSCS